MAFYHLQTSPTPVADARRTDRTRSDRQRLPGRHRRANGLPPVTGRRTDRPAARAGPIRSRVRELAAAESVACPRRRCMGRARRRSRGACGEEHRRPRRRHRVARPAERRLANPDHLGVTRHAAGPRPLSTTPQPSMRVARLAALAPARGSAEHAAIRPAPENSTARRSTSRRTSRGCATCFSPTWRRLGSEARGEETAAGLSVHTTGTDESTKSRLARGCCPAGRPAVGVPVLWSTGVRHPRESTAVERCGAGLPEQADAITDAVRHAAEQCCSRSNFIDGWFPTAGRSGAEDGLPAHHCGPIRARPPTDSAVAGP